MFQVEYASKAVDNSGYALRNPFTKVNQFLSSDLCVRVRLSLFVCSRINLSSSCFHANYGSGTGQQYFELSLESCG